MASPPQRDERTYVEDSWSFPRLRSLTGKRRNQDAGKEDRYLAYPRTKAKNTMAPKAMR